MPVPGQLRRVVVERARDRCEYCGLAQVGQEAAFHLEHVVAVGAGGETDARNLALACVSCSLRKGARQTGRDPQTGDETPFFNPRRETWREHFQWKGATVAGLTPTGRATISALRLNRPLVLAIREEETFRGRHPAPL